MVNAAARVSAVIVTFHPSRAALRQLLQAIAMQTQGVVIVDNTPGGAPELSEVSASEVAVIRNDANAGLAAAQNQGIRWAAAGGFTHVFMLDQDSVPAADCVERLYEAAHRLDKDGVSVGAVGPRVLDRRTGRAYSFKRFTFTGIRHSFCGGDAGVIATDFVIASGSLIAMDTLLEIGPMDEGLFIDRIDIDWCLRAAKLRYGVYGVCAARLQHEPGERSRRVWIGRWIEAAVHSPERNYYMIRNSVVLYRKPYAPLRWVINDALWLLGIVVISCVVAPARMRRLGLVLRGIWDGLRRVQGPLANKNPNPRIAA